MTNPNPKTLTLNPFPFRELTVRLDRARAYLSVSVPFTHTTSSVHGGGAAWDRRALTRHEVAPLAGTKSRRSIEFGGCGAQRSLRRRLERARHRGRTALALEVREDLVLGLGLG